MASNSPDRSNPPWLQITIALISLIGVLGAALIARYYWNQPVSTGDSLPSTAPSSTSNRTIRFTVSPSNPALDDTKVLIHQGDEIQVSAQADDTWSCYTGEVAVGAGGDSTYSRTNLALTSAPFCSLIGRIGIDGRLLPTGTTPRFFADTSGDLYLGANDVLPINCPLPNKNQCYTDNTGQINATITVKDNA